MQRYSNLPLSLQVYDSLKCYLGIRKIYLLLFQLKILGKYLYRDL